jgi:hypothetical protein
MQQRQDDITTHTSPAQAGVINTPSKRGRGPGPVLPAGKVRKARPVGSVRAAVVPMEGHAWATAAEYSETRGAGGAGEGWADVRAAVAGARVFGDVLLAIGRRAADKQARALLRRVGKLPSASSVDEAAADAVAGVVEACGRRRWWPVVSGPDWSRVWARPAVHSADARIAARLAKLGQPDERLCIGAAVVRRAHRGAWASLRSWSLQGGTARNGDGPGIVSWSQPASQDTLTQLVHRALVAAEAAEVSPATGRWRAAVARWTWRAIMGGEWPDQPAARARAMESARMVARVVADAVLSGGGVALARVRLGVEADAWRKAVQRRRPWHLLKLAALSSPPPMVREARGRMRRAALDWRTAAAGCQYWGRAGGAVQALASLPTNSHHARAAVERRADARARAVAARGEAERARARFDAAIAALAIH